MLPLNVPILFLQLCVTKKQLKAWSTADVYFRQNEGPLQFKVNTCVNQVAVSLSSVVIKQGFILSFHILVSTIAAMEDRNASFSV